MTDVSDREYEDQINAVVERALSQRDEGGLPFAAATDDRDALGHRIWKIRALWTGEDYGAFYGDLCSQMETIENTMNLIEAECMERYTGSPAWFLHQALNRLEAAS